jgi:hypothetical protein
LEKNDAAAAAAEGPAAEGCSASAVPLLLHAAADDGDSPAKRRALPNK